MGVKEYALDATCKRDTSTMKHIELKRIYDDASPDDGSRVLIDRLWPRGISKDDAQLEVWAKDLAPSDDLRKWFDHDPDKFDVFSERYREELKNNRQVVNDFLDSIDQRRRLTLLTATKDLDNCHAPVLKQYLLQR